MRIDSIDARCALSPIRMGVKCQWYLAVTSHTSVIEALCVLLCTTAFDFTVSVAVLHIDNNNIQNYVSVSAIVSADIEPGTNQLSSSNQDIKRISYIEPGNTYSSSGQESSQRHSQSCTLKNNDQQSFGKINGNC